MDEIILDAYERLFMAVVIRARRDVYEGIGAHRQSALEFIRIVAGEEIARKVERNALRRELCEPTEAEADGAEVSAGAQAGAGHVA